MKCHVPHRLTVLALHLAMGSRNVWAQENGVEMVDSGLQEQGRLSDRLDELEKRLGRLADASTRTRIDEARATQIRALVQDIIADADNRTSLLQNQMTGGFDKGFFINGPDGNFRMEFSGQLQTRYVFNRQNNSEDYENVGGFDVGRLQLKSAGHVLNPRLEYSALIQIGGKNDGSFRLLDSWLSYEFTDELEVRCGRFRPPFLKEHEVSSKRQLLADRSLVAGALGLDRNLGIEARYTLDRARIAAALIDADAAISGEQDWIVTTRAEALLLGKWSRLSDLTSWQDQRPTLALGIGARFRDKNRADPTKSDSQRIGWTVDLTFEGRGRSIAAAIVGEHSENEGTAQSDRYAVVVQGGWFVSKNMELVARYEWGVAGEVAQELSVAAIGFNRYFAEHDLKLTVDIGYGFNAVDSFWSSSKLGWRTDAPGEDGQIVFRTQFQLLF